jgi:pimeloyl-ACP methyl ester carboxylesterase
MPPVNPSRYLDISPSSSIGRARGTLVLLHGFPLSARMWEPQLSLANEGWRIIAPHLRGFGGDAGAAQASSVDDYAADVVDLLDSLRIEDAVVGGLSMGGYVAFAMLRLAPRYIRALVLADTRSQADTPEGVQGRRRMLALVQEKGPAAVADEMLPKLLGASTRRDDQALAERIRAMILANSIPAIAGGITALMTRPDSTPLLATIHVPTLIVVGEEDELTPPPLSRSMQEAIAGSELVTIPEAGHMSNMEQPHAFNTALVRFLSHRV